MMLVMRKSFSLARPQDGKTPCDRAKELLEFFARPAGPPRGYKS